MHKSAMMQSRGELTGRSEVKPHQCQQCLKSFSSNHQLVQHIRVHTGEKPYKCSYCDRRFKQLSHVQQHTRLHTGKSFIFRFNDQSLIKFYWRVTKTIFILIQFRFDRLRNRVGYNKQHKQTLLKRFDIT